MLLGCLRNGKDVSVAGGEKAWGRLVGDDVISSMYHGRPINFILSDVGNPQAFLSKHKSD